MALSRRAALTSAATSLALPALRRSRAEGQGVKVGVLTDMSGPYHDLGGIGAVGYVALDFLPAVKRSMVG